MNNAFRKEGEMPKGHRPDFRPLKGWIKGNPVDAFPGAKHPKEERVVHGPER